MSSARDEMLANIRRSLGVTGSEAPRASAVTERLRSRPLGIVPARGQLEPAERIALFKAQAERAAATVSLLAEGASVPEEIARFLRDNNLPASLRRGADPRLASLPWDATSLTVDVGPSEGRDLNAVSHALGGIAESGTVALISGPDNPTSLSFLPDNHIVVIAADDIAGDYETVLARVSTEPGAAGMPRSLNFITGPSRSGDIEQKLILGAHGPRRLHIVVTSAPEPAETPD
jgi:L-lactate dehydrogenase complex protein LldG